MIIFKKLRYKNLLSTGNVWTEIPLNQYKTTLISGKNGSGKSTVAEALVFVLYGKSFRKINKPQLLNSINQKELVVELEFSSGKDQYKIIRGLKPTIFEIWKDSVLLNQDAASKDYQEHLEKSILKLNYKSFTQVVILGSATYVPFMELPTGTRREVIEDILNIDIFSKMNSLLKARIDTNKSDLLELKSKISTIETNMQLTEDYINKEQSNKAEDISRIKDAMIPEINNLKEKSLLITVEEENLLELTKTIEDKATVKQKLDKLISYKNEILYKIEDSKKILMFYKDHSDCPTCKQGIEDSHKQQIENQTKIKTDEFSSGLEILDQKIIEVKSRLDEISVVEDKIRSKTIDLSQYRTERKFIKQKLTDYSIEIERLSEVKSAIDTSKLDNLNKEKTETYKIYEEKIAEKELHALSSTLLKDTGIKSQVIKQFIPIMNTMINKYLQTFDLFVDFQLDENFNEVIKSRYRDTFSYSSFSEGEKMRINLSILLSWRAIAKMRNSISTNLLFADEILDGASDEAGVDSLISIINSMGISDNVFVISHRGEIFADKFENHITFQKNGNFSEYVVQN